MQSFWYKSLAKGKGILYHYVFNYTIIFPLMLVNSLELSCNVPLLLFSIFEILFCLLHVILIFANHSMCYRYFHWIYAAWISLKLLYNDYSFFFLLWNYIFASYMSFMPYWILPTILCAIGVWWYRRGQQGLHLLQIRLYPCHSRDWSDNRSENAFLAWNGSTWKVARGKCAIHIVAMYTCT